MEPEEHQITTVVAAIRRYNLRKNDVMLQALQTKLSQDYVKRCLQAQIVENEHKRLKEQIENRRPYSTALDVIASTHVNVRQQQYGEELRKQIADNIKQEILQKKQNNAEDLMLQKIRKIDDDRLQELKSKMVAMKVMKDEVATKLGSQNLAVAEARRIREDVLISLQERERYEYDVRQEELAREKQLEAMRRIKVVLEQQMTSKERGKYNAL